MWLLCSTLVANSGPAKIYPWIYHQVLHVHNLQCAGRVAGVLQPDGDNGPLYGHSQPYHLGLFLIICHVQGTWLVCSTLTANSGPAKVYPLIYHQVFCVDNLRCAGHVAGVL
jgi:hypothetical protein